MLHVCPPTSNAQRQREFLERHPGYYQRYRAKRRAEIAALLSVQAAAKTAALPAPLAIPVKPAPLMLPAPVELPVIPGMNVIEAIPACTPELIPISQRATM